MIASETTRLMTAKPMTTQTAAEDERRGSDVVVIDEASASSNREEMEQQEQPEPETEHTSTFPPSIYRARRLLYLSHAVSQCSEKAWDFCVILFLAALSNYQSILWVSTYNLCSYGVTLLGGSALGSWLDRSPRLQAAQFCIGLENMSVLLATIACCILLTRVQHHTNIDAHADEDNDDTWNNHYHPWDILWLIVVHVFGSAANLLNQGFVVAIERDWIVVLSSVSSTSTSAATTRSQEEPNNNSKDDDANISVVIQSTEQTQWLNQTNVKLRQIYLTAKVLSPTLAGWIVGQTTTNSTTSNTATTNNNSNNNQEHSFFCDLHGAAVLVGILCILSLTVEYLCTRAVYHMVPALATRRRASSSSFTEIPQNEPGSMDTLSSTTATSTEPHDQNEEEGQDEVFHDEEDENTTNDVLSSTSGTNHTTSTSPWKIYWDQKPIVWAGISMALVSANLFTFGGVQTTFLLWKGMPVAQVGLWRGLSSFMGLAGTFVYQFFVTSRGVSVAVLGAGSISYLLACLTLACSAFAIPQYQDASVYLLVVGTILSRLGLWMFDVSVTLLHQQHIPEGVRSMIGGTQQAMGAFFTMLSGGLGLFFRQPQDFWILGMFAYGCVFIATLVYILGIMNPFSTSHRYANPVG